MRISFLTLFIFVLCIRPILTSNSSVLEQEALVVERDVSVKDMIRVDREVEERKIEGKYYELSDTSKKAQRGKGATGGSNVDHGLRRSKNSASSLLFSWISTFLHVSLALAFFFS